MATTHDDIEDLTRVADELAVAVTALYGGQGVHDAVRALRERATGDRRLVGLHRGGARATYWTGDALEHHRVADGDLSLAGTTEGVHRGRLHEWLAERESRLDWVHPEFRWVLSR